MSRKAEMLERMEAVQAFEEAKTEEKPPPPIAVVPDPPPAPKKKAKPRRVAIVAAPTAPQPQPRDRKRRIVKRQDGREQDKRTLYFHPAVGAKLDEFIDETGRSMSHIVNEAVHLYLEQRLDG